MALIPASSEVTSWAEARGPTQGEAAASVGFTVDSAQVMGKIASAMVETAKRTVPIQATMLHPSGAAK